MKNAYKGVIRTLIENKVHINKFNKSWVVVNFLNVTAFYKTNLIVTNTEIQKCLYMKVTFMQYPETPSI